MNTAFSINGISVQNIFQLYKNDAFIVNRRYQRKLVWGLEEKEKFIDSIIKSYPIPLILVCKNEINEKIQYEILDGMQRLNAITSFIEGDFSVNGEYFDLETCADTMELLTSEKLFQKKPILKREYCINILNYNIPFSITNFSEDKEVDETFRRINTSGRRLSRQDVRQAGAVGELPSIINDCAIYIRKDSSRNPQLTLRAMKNISIGDSSMPYGILLKDIFWSKQKIITAENIRYSRDEELVTFLVTYILDKENAETSSFYLDKVYNCETEENQNITRRLNTIDSKIFFKQFTFVFDELKKVLDYSLSFTDLIYQDKIVKVTCAYQVVFLALYCLLVEKNKKISNYKDLCDSLKDAFKSHMQLLDKEQKWNKKDRQTLIDAMIGVMEVHTSPSRNPIGSLGYWVKNFENILNESLTEQPFYDYKSSLIGFNGESKIKKETVSRAIKTLTAMTNSTHGECYIIIGVCENINSANIHKNLYSVDYKKYSNFFILGINAEAEKHYSTIESYKRELIDIIEHEPISDEFKLHIKTNIVSFKYSEKEILIMRASRLDTPQLYDKKFFIRESSDNRELTPDELVSFIGNFNKNL